MQELTMPFWKRILFYFFKKKFKPKRKHLLFSSVDTNRSAISKWTKNTNRNFDIVVYIYNGRLTNANVDYQIKEEGFKFQNFYKFSKMTNIEHYDAIWIVDDDIEMETEDINKMFNLFDTNNLWLAQPSYTKNSSSGWNISIQDDNYHLRFTNFVENGVAVFSNHALKLCVNTMKDIRSGWGADFIWPTILDFPANKIAIIDDTQCFHPKIESSLNDKIPRVMHRMEGEFTMERYNTLYFTPRVLGGKPKN